MNEANSDSKGMPQTSKIGPDEELSICALCGNKNEIENRFVTCVSNPMVDVYANAVKAPPKKSLFIKFDLKIWDLFLCHSCVLDMRDGAFIRKSKSLSKVIKFTVIPLWAFPLTYLLLLLVRLFIGIADKGLTSPMSSTIIGIIGLLLTVLPLAWIVSLIVLIVSAFLYILNKSKHRKFIQNKNIRKEKDKIKAFKEAGERILNGESSSFKEFVIPELPTEEYLLKMFPNKYVEYAESEFSSKRSVLRITKDKKYAIPKKWQNLPKLSNYK